MTTLEDNSRPPLTRVRTERFIRERTFACLRALDEKRATPEQLAFVVSQLHKHSQRVVKAVKDYHLQKIADAKQQVDQEAREVAARASGVKLAHDRTSTGDFSDNSGDMILLPGATKTDQDRPGRGPGGGTRGREQGL